MKYMFICVTCYLVKPQFNFNNFVTAHCHFLPRVVIFAPI